MKNTEKEPTIQEVIKKLIINREGSDADADADNNALILVKENRNTELITNNDSDITDYSVIQERIKKLELQKLENAEQKALYEKELIKHKREKLEIAMCLLKNIEGKQKTSYIKHILEIEKILNIK
jgi:recombinational DNA repair protein RecR